MRPVTIIIVNWNAGKQLEDCLLSVENFGTNIVESIVIVDNGSTDGSANIDINNLNLRVIHAHENLGFARACNVGAATARTPYLIFMNPDARLLGNDLPRAIAFMESSEARAIGICGVRLIGENGQAERSCARFPSWRTYAGKALGLSRLMPSLFPPHFMVEFDHRSNREVDQVIGAFFIVRREVFDLLGGFDERFFVYFEELDFSLRARLSGWGTWFLADVTAFHKGGGTSEQVKAHRLFYSLRSRMLYALKHFSPAAAWTVIAITLGIEPLSRLGRALLRCSMQEFRDTWHGYEMLWRDIPNILARKVDR